jgi:histidinol-phosphatase (PHP family)
LLTEFKTRGGKYVTLGTDSHTADRNWPAIDAARELIAEAGFDELTSFSQQQAEV